MAQSHRVQRAQEQAAIAQARAKALQARGQARQYHTPGGVPWPLLLIVGGLLYFGGAFTNAAQQDGSHWQGRPPA